MTAGRDPAGVERVNLGRVAGAAAVGGLAGFLLGRLLGDDGEPPSVGTSSEAGSYVASPASSVSSASWAASVPTTTRTSPASVRGSEPGVDTVSGPR